MGRSSGGGGGGSRSSGSHSSGSRSFGGRSSSGRSSRSSGSSFSSGGSSHSYHRYRHTTVYSGGGSRSMTRPKTPEEEVRSMFITFYVFWFIALVALMVFAFVMKSQSPEYQREPLAKGVCNEEDYIVDLANWGVEERDVPGMKAFFKKTGVQPTIILAEDGDIPNDQAYTEEGVEQFLTQWYGDLFTDEGHALFLYWDHGGGMFDVFWLTGVAAKTVIDDEACDVVFDMLDSLATSDLDDGEYFSKSFSKAASRIMRSPNQWLVIIYIGLPVMLGILVIIIVSQVNYKRKQLRVKELEAAEKILNSKTEDQII